MMTDRRRSGCVQAILCGALACAVPASAQSVPATPDTAAARLMVDSLVRAGAWRLDVDTVRLPADTVLVGGSILDTTLRVSTLAAGLIVLLFLGFATVLFARRFLTELDRRASIGVRSRWGGFGGGDDGWEVTPALTLLAATLILAIVTAVLASAVLGALAGAGADTGGAAVPAVRTSGAPDANG
jgi:hypothetical protein